jgi:Ser/Thr protein kinase RdoA (MazF antagonist)
VTVETAWDALAAWPDAELGAPLGGGSINEVRAVQVNGRRCVARISRREVADLDWEARLLTRLAQAGLGVPALVPTADGRLHSGRMVVMEWVDGAPPDGPDDWRAVAAYLRTLHELTRDWPEQRPGWSGCAELADRTRSGPVDLTAVPAEVLETCRRAWAALPASRHAVVHGDPNPTNIRVHHGTVVLLDWDEARVDSPLLDFAYVPSDMSGLTDDEHRIGRRAFYAWETAMFWDTAPSHAQKRLAAVVNCG